MLLLRRALVRLRDEFDSDSRRLYLLTGLAALGFALITLLVDWLLPFGGLFNLLRSLLLVPTAVSIFSFAYGVSLYFHLQRLENDEEWIPYRARFSPAWRRRIAVIVGAVLIVLAQGGGPGVGYTLTAAIIGAVVIAVLAFIRTSKQEASREELGIPDSRDVIYDAQKRRIERDRAIRQAARKKSREDLVRGSRKIPRPKPKK